jgi:hypothetical protein
MRAYKISEVKFLTLVIFSLTFTLNGWAQVINGYARATNQGTSGGNRYFDLSNVNESGDSFEIGDLLVIMQMQDNVIGTTSWTSSNFGNLGSIASAGLYETAQIVAITESGGTPTRITVGGTLNNSYNINNNASVQLITYPKLGVTDYTTTQNLSARDWDGNIGGVLAFYVDGTLTLNHNINVDGDGFRGATANGGSSANCGDHDWVYAYQTSDSRFAEKGEGIFRITSSSMEGARGKILNGGGGGNSHNGGGGGGGNKTTGGAGGAGWGGCGGNGGGQGGIGLTAQISASRVFMGGGGGSGEANNNVTQDGGDGGGIALIKADEIRTIASSGSRRIESDGVTASNSGNDGGSGGGAGGAIVFDVNTWNIHASSPLTIQSNGGNGGATNSGSFHGGGGGGGLGSIIFSGPQPTTNVTVNNTAGTGGANCNSCGSAPSGGGSNGDGIVINGNGPLPVSLVGVELIQSSDNRITVEWITASELNNDYFAVERSEDGKNFITIGTVKGKMRSNETTEYQFPDERPITKTTYYRLSQTDFDGTVTYFNVLQASPIGTTTQKQSELSLFPNPSNGSEIKLSSTRIKLDNSTIELYSLQGDKIDIEIEAFNYGNVVSVKPANPLDKGMYMVVAYNLDERQVSTLVVK